MEASYAIPVLKRMISTSWRSFIGRLRREALETAQELTGMLMWTMPCAELHTIVIQVGFKLFQCVHNLIEVGTLLWVG
jgi:hypothetical protein